VVVSVSVAPILQTAVVVVKAIPDNFICSISFDLMDEPVILCDGHSYERSFIEDWLKRSDKSPKTNLKLANKIMIPNLALKLAIEDYKVKIKMS